MKFITTALLVVFLPYLIQHPSIENWVVYGIGVTLNASLYILGRFKPKAIKTSPVKYQTSVKEKSSTFDWKRFCEEVGRRSLEKNLNSGTIHVRPYRRKDGTYVHSHKRHKPKK